MTVESTIEAQHGDYDDWYGWSDFDDSDDDSVNGDQVYCCCFGSST